LVQHVDPRITFYYRLIFDLKTTAFETTTHVKPEDEYVPGDR
jgi:hypothetical protein